MKKLQFKYCQNATNKGLYDGDPQLLWKIFSLKGRWNVIFVFFQQSKGVFIIRQLFDGFESD
jgi:hypothetical protein